MTGTRILNEKNEVLSVKQKVSSSRKTSIFGPEERMSTERTANIALLDFSGSMGDIVGRGDNRMKVEGVKEAISAFIVNLPSSVYFSLIIFNDEINVLWKMNALGRDKLKIIQLVQKKESDGFTSMRGACELAEKELTNVPNGYLKRVYLLTDGMPTDGDPSLIAETLKTQGVQIHTIGFGDGDEIDENLLRKMASKSASGTLLYYHFTDSQSLTCFLKKQTKTITQ